MKKRFGVWVEGRRAASAALAAVVFALTSAVAVAAPPAFGPTQNLPAGQNPTGIAVADFNGDGRQDAAVTDFDGIGPTDSTGVSIFFANTEGELIFDQKISFPEQPDQIVAGKVDGNSDPDLLIGTLTGEVILLEGNAGIAFGPPESIDVGGNSPRSLAYADFTGDGRRDLVVGRQLAGNSDIALVRRLGNGGWASPQSLGAGFLPTAVRLNSDKRTDLVALTPGRKVKSLIARKGPKPFRAAGSYIAGPQPSDIEVGDFNRDRRVDLAVVDSALQGSRNVISMLRGLGGGKFAKPQLVTVSEQILRSNRRGLPGDFPTSGVAADLNGNGSTDLAVALRVGTIVPLDNTTPKGAKRFRLNRGVALDGGDEPDQIAAPLLGGDAKRDLAWAGDDGLYWANQN